MSKFNNTNVKTAVCPIPRDGKFVVRVKGKKAPVATWSVNKALAAECRETHLAEVAYDYERPAVFFVLSLLAKRDCIVEANGAKAGVLTIDALPVPKTKAPSVGKTPKTTSAKLSKGAKVKARVDGSFYPGKIIAMIKGKKARVRFDDGDKLVVKLADVKAA